MKRVFLWAVAAFSIAALMVGATAAMAADKACTGPMGVVTIKGNVIARAGCDLTGTTVMGNVTVKPGGSLLIDFGVPPATIKGNLQSTGATSIEILTGTIGGNVAIEGTTGSTRVIATVKGNVEVQKSAAVRIRATVGGNVTLHDNTGSEAFDFALVAIFLSTVEGNVDIHDNSTFTAPQGVSVVSASRNAIGGSLLMNSNAAAGAVASKIDVTGNTVGKNLQCENNSPPPTDSNLPNTAQQKQGQCAGL